MTGNMPIAGCKTPCRSDQLSLLSPEELQELVYEAVAFTCARHARQGSRKICLREYWLKVSDLFMTLASVGQRVLSLSQHLIALVVSLRQSHIRLAICSLTVGVTSLFLLMKMTEVENSTHSFGTRGLPRSDETASAKHSRMSRDEGGSDEVVPLAGTGYKVGGDFSHNLNGNQGQMPLEAGATTVHSDPAIDISYFHQRDLFNDDDPFMAAVEPKIPFTLAVMARNSESAAAKSFKIASAQPQITSNEKGLLIVFEVIGTLSDGAYVPTLAPDSRQVDPRVTKIGEWLLTSSMQGRYCDFGAPFQHEDTSEKDPLLGTYAGQKYQAELGLPVMVSETGHSSTEDLFDADSGARQPKALPSSVWGSLLSGPIWVTWNDRIQFTTNYFYRERGFGMVQEDRIPKEPVFGNVAAMFRQMENIRLDHPLGCSANAPAQVLFFWSTNADMVWPRANQGNAMIWGILKRLGY